MTSELCPAGTWRNLRFAARIRWVHVPVALTIMGQGFAYGVFYARLRTWLAR